MTGLYALCIHMSSKRILLQISIFLLVYEVSTKIIYASINKEKFDALKFKIHVGTG